MRSEYNYSFLEPRLSKQTPKIISKRGRCELAGRFCLQQSQQTFAGMNEKPSTSDEKKKKNFAWQNQQGRALSPKALRMDHTHSHQCVDWENSCAQQRISKTCIFTPLKMEEARWPKEYLPDSHYYSVTCYLPAALALSVREAPFQLQGWKLKVTASEWKRGWKNLAALNLSEFKPAHTILTGLTHNICLATSFVA